MPAVREPAPLQSHFSRTRTITVALVQEPEPLQSHWCENQHHYNRTGARSNTIPDQSLFLLWSRQAVTVTLRAALTRHRTSTRTGSNGHVREITKSCGAAEKRIVPALIYAMMINLTQSQVYNDTGSPCISIVCSNAEHQN